MARQPGILWRDPLVTIAALPDAHDAARPGDRQLVEAFLAGDDQRRLGADQAERGGDGVEIVDAGDTDQLAGDTRRTGERPDEVENRPPSDPFPDRPQPAERGVVELGEEETDADLVEACL